MGVDNPVIVDMGGRFRHPIGHHTVPVPALAPPEMADLGTQAVPSLPLSGMPVNGGPICVPMPTAMSSLVVNGVQVGGATHMHATTMAETGHSGDSAAFPHMMHGDALQAKSA
ncbi:hypothetical protein CICLE_v10026805mg [Citrus x clementina]|uniref:Uncharacterized protein n=1 Tax=Citrus clementina TaxID=85681 RepID=V4SQR1_CITCL|nr:hypothetical protein CICLE_v10026805mg [Citrus x clementina]